LPQEPSVAPSMRRPVSRLRCRRGSKSLANVRAYRPPHQGMSRGWSLTDRASPRPFRGGCTTRRLTNPAATDLILQASSRRADRYHRTATTGRDRSSVRRRDIGVSHAMWTISLQAGLFSRGRAQTRMDHAGMVSTAKHTVWEVVRVDSLGRRGKQKRRSSATDSRRRSDETAPPTDGQSVSR